jgi:hypothetical protein
MTEIVNILVIKFRMLLLQNNHCFTEKSLLTCWLDGYVGIVGLIGLDGC